MHFHSHSIIGVVSVTAAALLCLAAIRSGRAAGAIGPSDSGNSRFVIDFSGYAGGSVEKWLQSRGYKFEKDAKNRKLLNLSIADQTFELTANGPMSGFIANDTINLESVRKVRIHWGVRRYPAETSYENKVNNEALMLYIFFGKKKISSGHVLIPGSPYFIGLFLCQNEQVNFPYKGLYFHTGGRFVCLGKPNPGESVVSEFELDQEFKRYFGKQVTPSITGIAFGIDTSKAREQGKAAAFIKRIEFLADVAVPASRGGAWWSGPRPSDSSMWTTFAQLNVKAMRAGCSFWPRLPRLRQIRLDRRYSLATGSGLRLDNNNVKFS